MNRSDLTDADIAAALWRLLEGMADSSDTSGPQGVHENSITGDSATADTDLTNFNAGNDTAFTPTLTPSMGTFTGQLNYSHPVSKQRFDRQHRLTLLCNRAMLMLGLCQPKVGRFRFCNDPSCLPAAKGSRMQVQSLPTWWATSI